MLRGKKVFLVSLFAALILQCGLAIADSRVIYEVVAANDLVNVDLTIPDSVKPGYHQMLVEVLDSTGVVRSKIALFCKDTDLTIHLDNKCPGLEASGVVSNAPTIGSITSSTKFDPKANPKQTQGILVTLFTLATVLLTPQQRDNKESNQDSTDQSSDEQGSLESVNAGVLAIRKGRDGRGDKKRKLDYTSFEFVPLELAKKANRVSFILARVLLDARYLRAMFGSLTWALTPIAAYCAWRGVNEIDRAALPLHFGWLVAIMAIAIFDAFAGFYAAVAYVLCVFFAGNLNTFSSTVTVVGTCLVMYAPALIASTIRPLHRTVENSKDFWNRLSDYAIGILLSSFAVKGLVGALSGLSGMKLEIVNKSNQFAIVAAIALLIRMLLEERAWYLYPKTLAEHTVTISNISGFRSFLKRVQRFFLFIVFSLPFVGPNKGFLIGVVIYLAGQVVASIDFSFGKSRILGQILPTGIANTIFVSIIGGFVSFWLAKLVTDSGHLIEATFWVMALPGLVLSLLNKAKGEPFFRINSQSKLKLTYVLCGIAMYFLLCCTMFGIDISAKIRSFIGV